MDDAINCPGCGMLIYDSDLMRCPRCGADLERYRRNYQAAYIPARPEAEPLCMNKCPECGERMISAEGCAKCPTCGWSACG